MVRHTYRLQERNSTAVFAADSRAGVSKQFARERTANTLAVRQSKIHHNNKGLRITYSDPTEPR